MPQFARDTVRLKTVRYLLAFITSFSQILNYLSCFIEYKLEYIEFWAPDFSVSDPDPDLIRIQSGPIRIRNQEGKNDPQKYK